MADQLDRLNAALADRYDIERELGAAGMATVYHAEDLNDSACVSGGAATMNDQIESCKPLVIIGPALVPMIGGAIVYHGLQYHNLPMANLGNRVSGSRSSVGSPVALYFPLGCWNGPVLPGWAGSSFQSWPSTTSNARLRTLP